MSTASSQLRIGMLSPGQSWTDFQAGLEVDAQRRAREQGPEQRRLADARRTKDGHGRLAVRRGQTLVGGDDMQGHRFPMMLVVLHGPSRSGKPGPDAVRGAKRSRLSPRSGCCIPAKTRPGCWCSPWSLTGPRSKVSGRAMRDRHRGRPQRTRASASRFGCRSSRAPDRSAGRLR